jgi:hypothetical protein
VNKSALDATTYFPPPERQGGWRWLKSVDEVRSIGGMDPERLQYACEWNAQFENSSAVVIIRPGYLVGEVIGICFSGARGHSFRRPCREPRPTASGHRRYLSSVIPELGWSIGRTGGGCQGESPGGSNGIQSAPRYAG